MSEFKFACPICGQHITADSKDTGSQISCPTCYRKIVVPHAPEAQETKFVVSASEANKPRPQTTPPPMEGMRREPARTAVPIGLIILLVLACGAVATLVALRGKIFRARAEQPQNETGTTNKAAEPEVPQAEYTGTNLWTLDLTNVVYPDTPVSGSIHHRAFTVERATLVGSNLTLRVGTKGSVELGLSIYFFNREPSELSGKTAEIKPTDITAPRVVLRWKETNRESQTFHSGYAMKVEFGTLQNNTIPGKMFLCLPDPSQSWVAGTFEAEVRKPSPPKPRPPASH